MKFVVPNRSFIELGRRLPIEQALTAHFSEYVSVQWERLCREYYATGRCCGIIINLVRDLRKIIFPKKIESIVYYF